MDVYIYIHPSTHLPNTKKPIYLGPDPERPAGLQSLGGQLLDRVEDDARVRKEGLAHQRAPAQHVHVPLVGIYACVVFWGGLGVCVPCLGGCGQEHDGG